MSVESILVGAIIFVIGGVFAAMMYAMARAAVKDELDSRDADRWRK